MATTYTPDPTATQAPASAPDPDDFPLESLPVDGDALNSASVLQAFKVIGDYIAWLKSPRAVGSSYTQSIRSYRNARLQRRFLIDHEGFTIGPISGWRECWDNVGMASVSANGNGDWAGRWSYSITNGGRVSVGAGLDVFGSNQIAQRLPWAGVSRTAGALSGGSTLVQTKVPAAAFDGDATIAMKWDFTEANHSITGTTEIAMGLCGVDQLGRTSSFVALNAIGAALILRAGDTTWRRYTKARGVAASVVDTTIAYAGFGTLTRMRIDVLGANNADTSTGTVVFFIGGTAISVTVDLTGITIDPTQLRPFFSVFDTNANVDLAIGPVDFAINRYPGDVGY